MAIGNYKTKSQQQQQQQQQQVPTEPTVAPADAAKPAASSAAPRKSTPSKQVLDAVEKGVEKDLMETEQVVEKAISYEDLLKKNDVSMEEARTILDALLVDGVYTEEVPLTSSTVITLRSRSFRDNIRTGQAVEALAPRTRAEVDAIISRYCIAGSLMRYRDERFEFPADDAPEEVHDEAFDARLQRLQRFPEAVVNLLWIKVAKFDQKLSVVLSEGAVEAF